MLWNTLGNSGTDFWTYGRGCRQVSINEKATADALRTLQAKVRKLELNNASAEVEINDE
jgi:hypothetical protein